MDFDAAFTAIYEPGEELGCGGFGRVIRARRRRDGLSVAVKFPAVDVIDDLQTRRFAEEAKVLSSLDHRGILGIIDMNLTCSTPYIVTELIEGETVDRLVAQAVPPPDRALSLFVQLCEAMDHAHGAGILHRDLKSSNVMVTAHDRIVILDYGLAHRSNRTANLTATGIIMGTPEFMAPELIRGGPATPATDIYAAGIIFYHLSTGRLPFTATDLPSLLKAHLNTPPPHPGGAIPEAMARLMTSMIDKHPENRPASFAVIGDELRAMRKPVVGSACAPTQLNRAHRAPRPPRQRPARQRSAPRRRLPPGTGDRPRSLSERLPPAS